MQLMEGGEMDERVSKLEKTPLRQPDVSAL